MKKLLAAIMLLSTSAIASPSLKLDVDQIDTLNRAYQIGESKDLGLTLAAIAMTESSAGKYKSNDVTGDYGVFQTNLKYTVKAIEQKTGAKMSWRQVRNLKQRLIDDMDTSGTHALIALEYWLDRHNGDWSKAVRSYNAGNNWNSSAGKEYLTKVTKNLRLIKQNNVIQK